MAGKTSLSVVVETYQPEMPLWSALLASMADKTLATEMLALGGNL